MIEHFVAQRYMKSKRRLNFITVISRISIIGVSLGVAALIVVLSVFNGFGDLAKQMMLEAEPHLTLRFNSTIPVSELKQLKYFLNKQNKIETDYLFSEGKVIIGNNSNFEILTVKGIEDNYYFSKNFRIRKFSDSIDSVTSPSISVSLITAIKMNSHLGDTLAVTSFQNLEKSAISFLAPRVLKTTVTSIYDTRNNQLNSQFVFMPLSETKLLFNKINRVAGIEIFLFDFKQAEKLKQKIINEHFPSISVITWEDTHKQLLTVMKIERWSAYLILSLIIAIASFNILSSLTMSVTVKQRDIGLMRSFGVTKKSIKRIFLYDGLITGLRGALFGFVIGMAIYFLQLYLHIYPLDPTKYVIDSIPVKLYFSDIFAITVMAVFLSTLSALYPAIKAAKTNIIEAIKWE